jgi:REP element-mobilizing transposase RayT
MAKQYRRNAKHNEVQFAAEHQLTAIEILQEAVTHISCRLHLVATDPTHIHALASWRAKRTWEQQRTSLKRALTISFKSAYGDRPWLADGASRKRVLDRKHFDYLITTYLPSHRGWKWCECRGLFLENVRCESGRTSGERSSPAMKVESK